jgi:hypothetical protein
MDPLILLAGRTAKELCFVASVLQRIGVAYVLIGANALLLHGVQLPRTTRDLDFVIAIKDDLPHIAQTLVEKGFRHGKIPHRFIH